MFGVIYNLFIDVYLLSLFSGDLVIANLVKSDEFDGWEYRCDMTNNIGGSSAFGSYTRIYVNDTVDGRYTWAFRTTQHSFIL